ncbi:MAG: ferredoxin [Streptococcaceae bacterium]|jgi:ferredoxin|nr:ferredoxin [Streptococcaceae bacterium]
MKIQLIQERCIACGICQIEAPNVFDYRDDGIVKFLNDDEVLEKEFAENETLHNAIRKCPTGALQSQP